MARPIRIERSGGWYHLTSRGNERKPIFRTEEDYRHFLALLEEATGRYQWQLHAFVLMANHYHLLVELREENLSRAMQWLNTSYGQWFNRRYHRVGHLFQGRFRGILVDDERWAVELSRYLHLNPMRIQALGLDKVQRARHRHGVGKTSSEEEIKRRLRLLETYPWSSYGIYLGIERKPEWLTCERVWRSFGRGKVESQAAYRHFVEQGALEGGSPSIWDQVRGQTVLGDEEFVQKIAAEVRGNEVEQGGLKQLRWRPSWERLVQCVEEAKGESWKTFWERRGDAGREMVFWLARRYGGMTLQQIGDKGGGLNYHGVDSALRAFGRRLRKDPQLKRTLSQIEKEMHTQKYEI
jgi:putative transposase